MTYSITYSNLRNLPPPLENCPSFYNVIQIIKLTTTKNSLIFFLKLISIIYLITIFYFQPLHQVKVLLVNQEAAGNIIGAICAAPTALLGNI